MRQAFSLVELSIVLVILGLLTGGILAGQSLIRAAEVRSVSAEYSRYAAAQQTFRDKYMALPGDMTNATSFWGVQHATPATCATTASTSPLTCNGNGDGMIDTEIGFTGSAEQFRYWQHLANAGLIEGSYSGVKGSAGNVDHAIPNTNVPSSRLNNAGWAARYISSMTWVITVNTFMVGAATSTSHPLGPALKPEEAWNLDTKMDDGKPGYGRIMSNAVTPACTTTAVASTAEYSLTLSALGCAFYFKL